MTRTMSCVAVRRSIGSLHDGELDVATQIRIEAHLAACSECRSRRDDLLTVQTLLRTGARRPESADYDDEILSGLLSSVMGQIRREHRFGWRERVGRVMTDASRVWIPGGAVACTVLGGVVLATVLSLLTPIDQHSLATLFHGLGAPGSNANPVLVARGVTLPTVSREQRLPVFLSRTSDPMRPIVSLAAVVTREGELSQVELLGSGAEPEDLKDDLFQLAAEIRFSPALYGGAPVAVNVVWLLEQTTVLGHFPAPVS